MFYSGTTRKRFTKWRLDLAIHDALAIARKRSFDRTFQELLAVAVSRSEMLRAVPISGYAGWTPAEQCLRGMLSICRYRRHWLRDVYEWDVPPGSPLQQFGSLARHVLATHPVPNFMSLVWFEDPSATTTRHQKLFRHLGLGNSIRGADLPIRLTQAMARFFTNAPDHLTVEQAVRWSQVRALGGDRRFAAAVLSSRIGTVFGNEPFWAQMLPFLIAQPALDLELIPSIIECMDLCRDRLVIESSNKVSGMSFEVFLNRVRKWVKHDRDDCRPGKLRWPNTHIRGFRHIESQEDPWFVRLWTIRELTDSRQLKDEGNRQQHCVAAYADECFRRRTSIWSLRCHGSLQSHRILTIEVLPSNQLIFTALGKCNQSPTAEAREMMEMWAEQEGLKIGCWV